VRVGGYETEAELGRGGAGVVYRARAADGRAVALKLLARTDADAVKRFARESRLQASLGLEAGFVPVLETGVHAGALYLVMPLVLGGTLRDRLARGPLGVVETATLGRALARALGAAHALGIVHRDVKPENVLFDLSGGGEPRALIADLGLAKHFTDATPGASQSASVSQSGSFRGTIGYMPPEQMKDAKTAGPAADVFALGAVLYECLVGSAPFAGETVLEVVARAESGSFARIQRFRPDVPRALASAIERALAGDPRARFADGVAFERALHRTSVARATRGLTAAFALVAFSALALGAWASGVGRAPGGATAPAAPAPGAPSKAALLANEAYLEALHGHDEHALLLARSAVAADASLALARAALAVAEADLDKDAAAAADADAALALDPDCPLALAARSWPDGEDPKRLERAERALSLDPKLVLGYLARGGAKWALHDAKGAIEDVKAALALDRHAAFGWLTLVEIESTRDTQAGLRDSEEGLALVPDFVRLHVSRAACFATLGDHAHVLAEANAVLAREPDNGRALVYRAMVRQHDGDHEGAAADAGRVIQKDPEHNAEAWLARGLAREELGLLELAVSDITRYLERAPGVPRALYGLGWARARQGESGFARKAYEELLARQPDYPLADDVRHWLAAHPASDAPPAETMPLDQLVAGSMSDLKGYLERATRAIRVAPADERGWRARAAARDSLHDQDAALADAEQAVELEPGGHAAWLVLGIVLFDRKDYAAATAAATRSIEINPSSADSWSFRSECERMQPNLDAALADAFHAIVLDPSAERPWRALAWTLADTGRDGPTREALDRYLQMNPLDANEAKAWLAQHPR
jgi:tetratricopeptide (TPR) repeat protein